MPFDIASASDRPNQTIHAAAVLHDNARSIAAACADASDGELVVAIVSQDHAFRGVWTIPRTELARHVLANEDGGWSLVYSPGTTIEDVEERCLKLARSAFARWEAIRRWSSKHR
jgi:hypothetical protein